MAEDALRGSLGPRGADLPRGAGSGAPAPQTRGHPAPRPEASAQLKPRLARCPLPHGPGRRRALPRGRGSGLCTDVLLEREAPQGRGAPGKWRSQGALEPDWLRDRDSARDRVGCEAASVGAAGLAPGSRPPRAGGRALLWAGRGAVAAPPDCREPWGQGPVPRPPTLWAPSSGVLSDPPAVSLKGRHGLSPAPHLQPRYAQAASARSLSPLRSAAASWGVSSRAPSQPAVPLLA